MPVPAAQIIGEEDVGGEDKFHAQPVQTIKEGIHIILQILSQVRR